jgi:protein phosphatase
MKLNIPELSLVVLIGASGAGKSTFAKRHFRGTEIISSDYCRGLVSDDENDQAASQDAFDVLHFIAAKRLAAGKLTVIDATNVEPAGRKTLIGLARRYHCIPVAIVLNLPEQLCHNRNKERPDRNFGSHVVRRHIQNLKKSLKSLDKEGFRHIHILNSIEEIATAEIHRQPLWNKRHEERGPFDIIGDIHGCGDELEKLLGDLGYQPIVSPNPHPFWDTPTYHHPEGRKAVFLGDLVDRGPRILDTLKIVRNMVLAETALCVPGNHDAKLCRQLKGNPVSVNHGLEQTLAEIEAIDAESREEAKKYIFEFLDGLTSHYVLDDGKLVVAHAGMKAALQGRGSKYVRDFALYGESTGEIDEFGLPVRHNWAAEYRGAAMVVYGHTPVPEAEWLNNTIDVDTGCVFGGKLTALRYPERELVSVAAAKVYCEPAKPLDTDIFSEDSCNSDDALSLSLNAQQKSDDVLDIRDVLGKRSIATRLYRQVTIREENAAVALEVMSRFGIDSRWLVYLPPTMSPVATATVDGLLEYPTEAFAYYRQQGVDKAVCEEKHMGSRAIAIVCQDETVAARRFGVADGTIGSFYTRTGRAFFEDETIEAALLARLKGALTQSGFWETMATDWVCLDCELMPWSAKAQGLLKEQYAPVGTTATKSLTDAVSCLRQARDRGCEVRELLDYYQQRVDAAHGYVAAYRRYCWQVDSIADLKLAPFHILATEGNVHIDRPHTWHMEEIAKVCQNDPELLFATQYRLVDLADEASVAAGVRWWEELTASGGEGMVVKPLDFIFRNDRGIVQPAVKCRGKEYLRIIYGGEYTLPHNLERLRQRSLSTKRSLALREFALGIEALERFVRNSPLRQVHECVFGVLALESEPVDPRL